MEKTFIQLRKSGLRITPVRKEIFAFAQQKKSPITIPEIQEYCAKKKLSPNTTTLYRQMETLVEKNIFQKVSVPGSATHYELITHHHHHFSCTKCAIITCIENKDIEQSIHALEHKMNTEGFTISQHSFSLSGLCQSCTK